MKTSQRIARKALASRGEKRLARKVRAEEQMSLNDMLAQVFRDNDGKDVKLNIMVKGRTLGWSEGKLLVKSQDIAVKGVKSFFSIMDTDKATGISLVRDGIAFTANGIQYALYGDISGVK